MQSSSQIIITNKPAPSRFYRLDALPVAQPTVSKHWRESTVCVFLLAFTGFFSVFVFFCVMYVSPVKLYCYMGQVAWNKQDDYAQYKIDCREEKYTERMVCV